MVKEDMFGFLLDFVRRVFVQPIAKVPPSEFA
jgi:hypothetical protein